MIPVCYGSDEEQARTATIDAVEQKCHTHRLKPNEREVEERKNTQIYVVHLDQGYIHERENKKLFITNAVYKWKLIPKNTGHPCLI